MNQQTKHAFKMTVHTCQRPCENILLKEKQMKEKTSAGGKL